MLPIWSEKANETHRRVLEGADVGVLESYMAKETREPGETYGLGRATTALSHADNGIRSQGRSGYKRVRSSLRYPGPIFNENITLFMVRQ